MANPPESTTSPVKNETGIVYLVGAGPGAVDLITVRGAKLLAQANIVLHDALVTSDMLALCPQAIKISVGKRSGQRSAAQEHINQQLVEAAQQHAIVVRLKGGDPMLFGRADEEMTALEQAGIRFEIVPGITTAMAAAASVKLPLTKRGVARSVALFTSSTAPGESVETRIPDCDTLIQYMGGKEAILTAQRMLAKGFPESHPIVIVQSCSRPEEQHLHLTLADLAHGLPECDGPVLVMMGEAMRDRNSN
ncbi:uroporphyrinogen-III C-methyltransferase [Undibacterium amnicola]|uniref:uroporphyrinogen-III C-methyltransferase n=1 Tax=Undibacterium amnicola TaxID=1834038 RepID=A0ABR6XP82_9BURK|nr:uroporphyrinogen-III C-methyltransferase [Undibacterium amnicola]MBC3831312.1 uroporphyrinogen-III C-methyltransferase [Undibacterium amnicola]